MSTSRRKCGALANLAVMIAAVWMLGTLTLAGAQEKGAADADTNGDLEPPRPPNPPTPQATKADSRQRSERGDAKAQGSPSKRAEQDPPSKDSGTPPKAPRQNAQSDQGNRPDSQRGQRPGSAAAGGDRAGHEHAEGAPDETGDRARGNRPRTERNDSAGDQENDFRDGQGRPQRTQRRSSEGDETHLGATGDRQDRSVDRLGIGLTTSQNRLSIGNVARGSVFGRAGIRQGDVIVSVNGRRVFRQDDFSRWIFEANPNERVTIVVLRDGREEIIYVNAAEYLMLRPASNRAVLGVNIARQYPDEVILSNVNPDGPAARAGLKRGDEILSVDGEEVRSVNELLAAIARFQPGDEIEIEYARGEEVDTTVVRLDAAAATLPQAQYGSEHPPRRLDYGEGAESEITPGRPGAPRREGPRDGLLPGRVRDRIEGR